jgi:hypothetical protein
MQRQAFVGLIGDFGVALGRQYNLESTNRLQNALKYIRYVRQRTDHRAGNPDNRSCSVTVTQNSVVLRGHYRHGKRFHPGLRKALKRVGIAHATSLLIGGKIMLYTIAVVLIILWLLGLVTSYTVGGFIHILLVVAVIMILLRLISGRGV